MRFAALTLFTTTAVLLSPIEARPSPNFETPTRASRRTDAGVTASVSLTAPSSARPLARSVVSFSIEGDRWPEWVSGPNTFFNNLLRNIGGITGRMPDVRVGADSEDRTTFDASVNTVEASFPPPSTTTPYPEAYSVRVSSQYYALSSNLPSGTHMVWGVNFGSGDIDNAVSMAASIAKAFAPGGPTASNGVVLDAIEIGNEADLYVKHGNRSAGYDINAYTTEWEAFASRIIPAANLEPDTSPRLWLGSFSSPPSTAAGAFSAHNLYATGVLSTRYGAYVNTFSQHHYQSSVCPNTGKTPADIQTFMAKSTVRSNLSLFDSDAQETNGRGLTYILGETNSISCHGYPGVSNTASAAVWAVDYVLQAVVRGTGKVYFHNGIGYKYNLMQPVALDRSPLDNTTKHSDPYVQPEYYGAIAIASFVGASTSTTTLSEIDLSSQPYLSGYAAYDGGRLARAILVNSKQYLSSQSSPRGSVTATFDFSGSSVKPMSMNLRRLSIASADAVSGLTFDGLSYETSSGAPKGTPQMEVLQAGDGVKLSDTEVVLVEFAY